jgi:hypothetical protein
LSAHPVQNFYSTAYQGIPSRGVFVAGSPYGTTALPARYPVSWPTMFPEGLEMEEVTAKAPQKTQKIGLLGKIFPVMAFSGAPIVFLTSLLGVKTFYQDGNSKKKPLQRISEQVIEKVHGQSKMWNMKPIMYQPPSAASASFLTREIFGTNSKSQILTYYHPAYAQPWLKQKVAQFMKIQPQRLMKFNLLGRHLVNWGVFPKNIVGLLFGVASGQPSILVCHLLQNVLLKENPIQTTILSFMGAMFTLGFANDIENTALKRAGKPPSRQYDMRTLKAIFNPYSAMPLWQRPLALASETENMLLFFMEDHVVAFKRASGYVKSWFQPHPNQPKHDLAWLTTNFKKMHEGKPNELETFIEKNSVGQSSLFIFLNYLANIPHILSSNKTLANEFPAVFKSPWLPRYCQGMFLFASLVADSSFIMYALTGKNAFERIPAVGQTMDLTGTLMGYKAKGNPVAFALQKLGGALNSIYFAYKAKNA